MSDRNVWLLYVALAGLAWGTYVPLIFYGGSELGGKPGSRIFAILCVGGAYFVIGVLFPLVLFLTKQYDWPDITQTGLIFSSLAGAAGAIGAICVIFATKSAVASAQADKLDPSTYRVFIAPLIFGLAPVINVLVSTIWHPEKGEPLHFHLDAPGWKLWVGILLVGAGAALVLFSKEEEEAKKARAAKKPAAAAVAQAEPAPVAEPPAAPTDALPPAPETSS